MEPENLGPELAIALLRLVQVPCIGQQCIWGGLKLLMHPLSAQMPAANPQVSSTEVINQCDTGTDIKSKHIKRTARGVLGVLIENFIDVD